MQLEVYIHNSYDYLSFPHVLAFGNIKGDIELSHCSHINAARALHIVATIIGTVALMMGLFAAVSYIYLQLSAYIYMASYHIISYAYHITSHYITSHHICYHVFLTLISNIHMI